MMQSPAGTVGGLHQMSDGFWNIGLKLRLHGRLIFMRPAPGIVPKMFCVFQTLCCGFQQIFICNLL